MTSLHFLVSLGGLLVIGIVGVTFLILVALGIVRRRSREVVETSTQPQNSTVSTSSLSATSNGTTGSTGARRPIGCEKCRVKSLRECRCTIVLYRNDASPKTSTLDAVGGDSVHASMMATSAASSATRCIPSSANASVERPTATPSRLTGLGDRQSTTVRHRETSAGRRKAMKPLSVHHDSRVLQTSL